MTVEDAKCVQSNAFIKSDIFSEFELKPGRGDAEGSDDLSFSINLNVIIECLNMFGGVGAGVGAGWRWKEVVKRTMETYGLIQTSYM